MMKFLHTILVLCFISNITHAQTYGWVPVITSSISGTPNFSDLFFINDNTGWINSNTANSTFYTVDGSGSFATQSIASTIDAIHMLDTNNGYAAADDGSIYRTTSGGTNWNFLAPTFVNLNDITFPLTGSTTTGYACGDNGAIYSVTSLGADIMTSGVVSNLESITFATATEGWACGELIIHFTGSSWQKDQTHPTVTYNAIYFTDNQDGWAVGNNGIIIHTTDGQNWVAQTNPDPQHRSLYSVFFLNSNEGWAVGVNGIVLHTTNGGTTWTVEANGLTSDLLTGVQFTSTTNGYVTGNNKTLLKFTQLTSIEENEKTSAMNIYPNPTDGIIKFDIPYNQQVEFAIISDMTGRELIRKNNLFMNEINLESLHKGFYSIQIVTDKQKYYGKIIKE